jgi:5'-deoxynucleotidase
MEVKSLNSAFYAMLSRMKYINRWGLMRNTKNENLSEHSLETAFIAHALGIINREIFNGDIDAEHLAVLAMYHDVTEIITGDMPTPVKYYSPQIRAAYREVEQEAGKELLTGLPESLRKHYTEYIVESETKQEYHKFVKAADKLSALIKCLEEKNMGNQDFSDAENTIRASVKAMQLPEADYFLEEFIPAYMDTIDKFNDVSR